MKKLLNEIFNPKGITVLELLIAMAILTFIIGGGFTVMAHGYKLFNNTQEKTDTRYTERIELETKSKGGTNTIELSSDSNCLVYEGETNWSTILADLGLTKNKEKVPANTTIYIKGNLFMDGNNKDNGKFMYGEGKDSVRIYVDGNFTTDSGSKVGGVTIHVRNTFYHKKGDVESTAIIYTGIYFKENSAKDNNNVFDARKSGYIPYEVPKCGDDFPLPPKPEYAVYANSTITLKEGAIINGDVGTHLNSNAITLTGGAKINGQKVYDLPKVTHLPPFPSFPSYPTPKNQKIKDGGNQHDVIKNGDLNINNWMVTNNNYILKLDSNVSFKNMNFDQNITLRIDTGNSDKEIVVDHLNIKNGHIEIIGNGKLTIYVRDNITMGSGSTINKDGSIDKLKVYYQGTEKLKLTDDEKIFGSLYAKNASIEINGSSGLIGHIFTGGKEVIVRGGVKNHSMIFAPNAEFQLNEGGQIFGTVICNSFVGTGGSNVTYEKIDLKSMPF